MRVRRLSQIPVVDKCQTEVEEEEVEEEEEVVVVWRCVRLSAEVD